MGLFVAVPDLVDVLVGVTVPVGVGVPVFVVVFVPEGERLLFKN